MYSVAKVTRTSRFGCGKNFPSLPLLFQNVCELHTGRAFDAMVGEVIYVPVVDLFVAGFVCKSVLLPESTKVYT